ncbi:MAG: flagellar biosynthesis protein FliQ [Fimbriimonadales bacterium]
MNQTDVLELGRQAVNLALNISMPILIATLVVGMGVAIFQAVTQVQEMTLTYVPKILAVVGALALFGSWMLSQTVSFTSHTLESVQNVGRR